MRIHERPAALIATLLIIVASVALGFLIPLASGGSTWGWGRAKQAEALATSRTQKAPTYTPTPSAIPTGPLLVGLSAALTLSTAHPQPTATPAASNPLSATPAVQSTTAHPPTALAATHMAAPPVAHSPTATSTAQPTGTPTATQVLSGTPKVTQAATPASLPTSSPPMVRVQTGPLNVRAGPGPDFAVLALAAAGDRFMAEGRTADGAWWRICCVLNEQRGWVSAAFVNVEGDIEGVPVLAD